MTKRHGRAVAKQETDVPDPMWCAWCRQRPAEGSLTTVALDSGLEVNETLVLLCELCGGHFDGGTAQDRPGDCRYEFELFGEDGP